MNVFSNLSKIVVVGFLACASLCLFGWEGAGLIDDPYEIKTRADLETLADDVEAGNTYAGQYFKLMNDIVMDSGFASGADTNFMPIGYYTSGTDNAYFEGHFDGNGKTISNLYIDLSARPYVTALFAGTRASTVIQNLCLVNVNITGNTQVGGLVGQNNGSIVQCSVTGKVSGTTTIGGLVGYNTGTVEYSYANVDVTGVNNVGGFCGYSENGRIENCYSVGKVTWGQTGRGFGSAATTEATPFVNCYYDLTINPVISGFSGTTPLSTSEMTFNQSFVDSLNGAVGVNTPFQQSNALLLNNGYPVFTWQSSKVPEGSKENPYQIKTRADLDALAANVEAGNAYTGQYFKLMNDIVMDSGFASGADTNFMPIGYVVDESDYCYFAGYFDGDSHVITNLYINQPNLTCVGFFSYILHGTITNLGLKNVDITGDNGSGGLCGLNENSIITNCYVTGAVTGTNYVGGFCGRNNGTITNCYATGAVTGTNYVGGFCGGNYGKIANCYVTGVVTGTDYVSGFCGFNYRTITDCYFDKTICDKSDDNAIGLPTAELKSGKTVLCLNANQSETPWRFNRGNINDGYPILEWQNTTPGEDVIVNFPQIAPVDFTFGIQIPLTASVDTYPDAELYFTASIGTITDNILSLPYYVPSVTVTVHAIPDSWIEKGSATQIIVLNPSIENGSIDSPYQIKTRADLEFLAATVNTDTHFRGYHFKLINDIDMTAGFASDADTSFTPIGYYNSTWEYSYFEGHFDGNGKTISNLYIDLPARAYVTALFAGTRANTVIQNLCLVNVNITGSTQVGGLVGQNRGQVFGCSVTGNVTGVENLGVIFGYNYGGIIENCYAAGTVKGANYIGGFCGHNYGGTIENCYAAGTVKGANHIGGFVGYNNDGTIENCYAAGTVGGRNYTGGFVGYNASDGIIKNCYAAGNVTGIDEVGGFCGHKGSGTIANCYFDKFTSRLTDNSATGLSIGEMVLNPTFVDSLNNGAAPTPWAYGTHNVNSGYPVLTWQGVTPSAYGYGAIGQTITIPPGALDADSKSKLIATYMPPFGKQKTKTLKVKMLKGSDDTFEIKGKIRLLDNKAYKQVGPKAKQYTQEAISDSSVQAPSVTVNVQVKGDDKAYAITMSVPMIVSVFVDTVMVKGKPNYYAIAFVTNAGAKPKGWLERGTQTAYQGKLSAAIQKKYTKLPQEIQDYVSESDFNNPANGIFIFKLNKKFAPDAFERVDFVIDNGNGLAAVTLP